MSTTATTILNQLGGSKFIAMTGSKNFVGCSKKNNFLSMHLIPNRSKAKYLKIELNSMNTYTLTFSKPVKKYDLAIVKVIEDVYCDMLQSVFTEVTGLDTYL